MMAFSLIQELLSALSAECPGPSSGRGGLARAFLPRPPSSSSFNFVGNERSGLENWSCSELFTFNMEIVVCDEASGFLLQHFGSHSVKELLLHIGAQLWGLAFKCR